MLRYCGTYDLGQEGTLAKQTEYKTFFITWKTVSIIFFLSDKSSLPLFKIIIPSIRMVKQKREIKTKSSIFRNMYIMEEIDIWLVDLDVFLRSLLHLVERRINKDVPK